MTTSRKARTRRRRLNVWPFLALLVVIAGVAVFIRNRQAAQSAASTEAQLDTTTARETTFRVAVNGPGTLAAAASRTITMSVNGTITMLPSVGDAVTKGQLIVRVDPAPFQRAVANAQIALDKARASLTGLQSSQTADVASQAQSVDAARVNLANARRDADSAAQALAANRKLYAVGGISRQALQDSQDAYDKAAAAARTAEVNLATARGAQSSRGTTNAQDLRNAQLAVQQAQLSLEGARADLAGTKVYAPIAGHVAAVNAELGGASSGNLATIIDDRELELPVQVDETQIAQVKTGQRAEITVDAVPDRTFTGKVTAVSPQAQVVQNIPVFDVTVRIGNDDGALRAGMSAEADIISQQIDNVIVIPKRAVETTRNRAYVQVLGADGKTVERTRVRTGPDDGTNIVVTSGLKPGDTVVLPARQTTTTTTNGGNNRGFGIPFGGGGPR